MSKQQKAWTDFLKNENDCYAIFQVNQDEDQFEDRAKRIFSGMTELKKLGLPMPAKNQYDAVYCGVLPANLWNQKDILRLLENLYEVFNISHPDDYTGRRLSVSDVVAIKLGGEISFWFVDTISFTQLEDFA